MTDLPWEHAAEARAALNAIVTDPEHGPAALSSPQTMSNLLKDLLPDAPREKGLLVAAAEAGLPDALRQHVAQGMDGATATRLAASSLAVSAPFTPEACSWVSGELAIALGISEPRDVDAARSGYSANEAPTQGYAIPPAAAFGQVAAQPAAASPASGFPGGPPSGFDPSNPQGGQAPASNPQQGFAASNPQQGFAASNPQSGFAGGSMQPGYQAGPQPGFQGPATGGSGGVPGFGVPAYQVQPGRTTRNNPLAMTSLILGLVQIPLWITLIGGFVAALGALICGIIGLKQVARRGELGRGMSITGIILGALGVIGGIITIIIIVVVASHSSNYGQY